MSTEEKELRDLIKKLMKQHGLTSYNIGIIDSYIVKIKITQKGWQRLLVPIKGYYYDDFEVYKIMHLDDELYFIVKKEHQTYEVPYKKEFFRYTWDELVKMVESTKWSIRTHSFGGKENRGWRTNKLKCIKNSLRCYDAHEEIKEKLSESQIRILVKIQESETSFAEKLVDKLFGY